MATQTETERCGNEELTLCSPRSGNAVAPARRSSLEEKCILFGPIKADNR